MHVQWAPLAKISAIVGFIFLDTTQALSEGLVPCLQNIKSSNKSILITPASVAYDTDRLGYNINFNYKPSALYHPATEADAAAAIQCAVANKVAVAPRSGGHSFEGYGQGGKDGTLVIDLSLFQKFSMDTKTGIATIGAGFRLGPLYSKLWAAGQYLIPAGTCPSVGIGGHALGGGLGMLGRKYGILTDSVVGMKVIDAKGAILKVSAKSNPDLFWALRGAGGGSFGLVTEFQIQAYKAPLQVTTMVYTFPLKSYRAVIDGYGKWGMSIPEEIFGAMSVRNSGIELRLNYLGSKSNAQKVVAPLFKVIGDPVTTEIKEGSWYQAATRWAGGGSLENPNLNTHRYHRGGSLIYRRIMTTTEVDILYKYLSKLPEGASSAYFIIEIWGGKIDRPSSTAAFDNHRGVFYGFDFGIAWKDSSNNPGVNCVPCLQWSSDFRKELYALYGGPLEAYQNYIELDLPNSLQAYYGSSLPRLKQIKKQVDPNDTFNFPQSIPLP
ncbi:hypothetical protein FBU30_009261 [Linnemannia zychae]|nr:hypothetical protein FBU30_009261 [Linnemannia zychae]